MSIDTLTSPGLILREELSRIFPFDANENAAFVTRLDDALLAEGNLSKLIYDSTLNYFLRRLITVAEYLKRKYYGTTGSEFEYWSKLREYLRNYTKIPPSKQERIFTLLRECVKERNRTPSSGTRNSVVKKAKKRGVNCYICGREVLYNQNEDDPFNRKAEIEHIWPKALGGSNNETNLTIACERCNRIKADYIDYSDFHYEEICAVTDERMADSFNTDFKWYFRIAILAKSNFSCSFPGCNRTAKLYGELQLQRIDSFDSWHFLNVKAYCERHARKGDK